MNTLAIDKTIPILSGIYPFLKTQETAIAGITKIIEYNSPTAIKHGNEIKTVAKTFFANNFLEAINNIGPNTIILTIISPR